MKNITLVVYLFSYVCAVTCFLFKSNSSDPVWKQLAALEHIHTFLIEVQQEIKESRDLLKHMHNGYSPNNATDAIPKTLVQDLSKYLSPTEPQSLLRTNTIVSTSTNPTTASVVKLPGPQQQTPISFQKVHDYVFPDLAPNYRDIFAPDAERQGDATEKYLIPSPWKSSNSENLMTTTVSTNLHSTSEVPTNANDLQILYTQTTKTFSVGDILEGMVLETTTPDAHPQLHNEIVRESTGYFSVGVENLLMLIVTKDPEHVKAVLEPAYSVIQNLEITNNRANHHWLGHPMLDILHTVTAMLAPGVTDILEIKAKANLLWTLLKNRRTMLGDEVNRILDFADGMVNREDGEKLFDRLDDFLHFPNVSTELLRPHYKTGRELCEAIIRAFDYPFSFKTVDRQRLVNSANAAFKEHFGEVFNVQRRAGVWHKLDSWFANYYKPNTKRVPEFRKISLRSSGSRMPVTYSRSTKQTSVHGHVKFSTPYSQSIYKRPRPFGILRNSNSLKPQSNRNKLLQNYKFRTTRKRFSKRFHLDAKKFTIKPVESRYSLFLRAMDHEETTAEGLEKKHNKKIQRRVNGVITSPKIDELHDETPNLGNKWITRHTESYPKKYISLQRRHTNFIRQADTAQHKLDEYPQQAQSSYSNIKLAAITSKPKLKRKTDTNTAEIKSEDRMDGDDSIAPSAYSDEKEILNVNLLNRLLNVTSEESLEYNKPLNVSIETDDDVDILKHLKEVLYDK